MHELTLQTFWGTPLALLPSGILLTWVVQMRIATLVAIRPRRHQKASLTDRAKLLRLASSAAGFAVASSALAAMTSGVCIIFRFAGQVPLLAMQSLALLAMLVVAATLTVEGNAALTDHLSDSDPGSDSDSNNKRS